MTFQILTDFKPSAIRHLPT